MYDPAYFNFKYTNDSRFKSQGLSGSIFNKNAEKTFDLSKIIHVDCPLEKRSQQNLKSIDENTKIRFYHTPKSGGTAIFNMTRPWKNFTRAHPESNHIPIKKHTPKKNEVALTIIRHPYDRFVSAFYHLVDSCNEEFYYRYAAVSDCEILQKKNIDFGIFKNDPNEFLMAYVNITHPYHKEANVIFHTFSIFKPQFYWLSNFFQTNIHDQLKIILHQENLEKEFNMVAKKLGYRELRWPDNRRSNRRITQETKTLNDYSKSILQKLYKDDFKYFCFVQ